MLPHSSASDSASPLLSLCASAIQILFTYFTAAAFVSASWSRWNEWVVRNGTERHLRRIHVQQAIHWLGVVGLQVFCSLHFAGLPHVFTSSQRTTAHVVLSASALRRGTLVVSDFLAAVVNRCPVVNEWVTDVRKMRVAWAHCGHFVWLLVTSCKQIIMGQKNRCDYTLMRLHKLPSFLIIHYRFIRAIRSWANNSAELG